MKDLVIGDKVQMKKKHPCGGSIWTVKRVGADIKLVCDTCNREIMLSRSEFNKRVKNKI